MAYVSKLNDEELTDLDLSKTIAAAPAEQSSVPATNVVALPAPKPKAAEVRSFDYAGLSAAAAKEAEAAAKRIRHRLSVHSIEIGKDLLGIKKVLKHGKFGKWLEFHFGWKERTAQNYMNSAIAFGSTPQVIDLLPPSTVYKLAAKSTPDAIRQSVIDEIKRGEKPDPKQIEKKIAATKNAAPQKAVAAQKMALDGSQKPSNDLPDDVLASLDRALAAEEPETVGQHVDGSRAPCVAEKPELRATAIVEHLKKRFRNKFPPLRDAILETEWAALKKALQDA
ncbi:DUF3102 domain-containing protein [Shinella sp. H4-D48]|uniref:DUF3102 domain-containing protein n=1 Tax=Shinella sp. H4-D48 TaxID=2925841 RepID=UPI001F53659D|nr:DUF3102 domain-containing protein [Shinella sp. H4-D48]UNK37485.1 DUF3102 domain-containing protein [Shinella sp. H4-D48]